MNPSREALMRLPATRTLLVITLLAGLRSPVAAQQMADTTFDTHVVHPAFVQRHPRVLFDAAHHNFHTPVGRYWPFAELITHDGCVVTSNAVPFSAASLAGFDVLVISNALGSEDMSDSSAARPAFTPGECDAVRDWVRGGGNLLLIADHAPMGSAARTLAARFDVDMRNGVTIDTVAAHLANGNPSLLVFSRANGLLGHHPILAGRDTTERIDPVMTFTGQSLKGPPGASVLLALSPAALDLLAPSLQAAVEMAPRDGVSAAGRAQGLAFTLGRGRVVVLGEAAMLSAQVAGPARRPMGMNVPGSDDRQFALNVVRWLAGSLR
jgi:hypothetical protein